MMSLELHADVVVVVGRFRYSCRMPKYEKIIEDTIHAFRVLVRAISW